MNIEFIDYPNLYLDLVISSHIIAGAIGAFILCPAAFLVRKGNPLHRRIGRWFIIDVIFICVTGFMALLDPAFLGVYWKEESDMKGFGAIFQAAQWPNLFFMFILFMFLYSSVSAVRLWRRIDNGRGERITSNPLDWVLALGMGVFASIYLGVGFEHLLERDDFAATFVVGPFLMIAFVLFDVYTFVFRPRVSSFPWWLLHVVKLMFVWAGLLQAFWLRLRAFILPEDWWEWPPHQGTIIWVLLIAAAIALFRRESQTEKNQPPNTPALAKPVGE